MKIIEEEGEGVKKAAGRLDQLMAEEASLTPRRRSRRLSNTSVTEDEVPAPELTTNKISALDKIDEDAEEKEELSVPLKKRRVIKPISDLFDDDCIEPEADEIDTITNAFKTEVEKIKVKEIETIEEVKVNSEESKQDDTDAFEAEKVDVVSTNESDEIKSGTTNDAEEVAVVQPEDRTIAVKAATPEKQVQTTQSPLKPLLKKKSEIAVETVKETAEEKIKVSPSGEAVDKKSSKATEEDQDEQSSDKENSSAKESKSDFEKSKLWLGQPIEEYFSHTQIMKPKTNMLVKADVIPRQKPKSGKFWKAERKQFNHIKKDKGHRLTFEQRIKRKEEQAKSKELAELFTNRKKQKKQELREKIEANKKQKEENEKKAEIYQVINNPNKIKRMKKKQIRMLAKRDTLDMKTGTNAA